MKLTILFSLAALTCGLLTQTTYCMFEALRDTNKPPQIQAPPAPGKSQTAAEKKIKKKADKADKENISVIENRITKIIQDPLNNMTIFLYRMKENDPTAPKTIIYSDRVTEWFANPAQALAKKGYADTDSRKATSIQFHRFSKDVDKYALKWGYKKTGVSNFGRDVKEMHLPGAIELNGKRYEGIFVYVIDNKNLCFHRFFHVCDWKNKIAGCWQIDVKDETK